MAAVALWAIYRSSLRVAEAGPEIVSSRLLLTLLTIAKTNSEPIAVERVSTVPALLSNEVIVSSLECARGSP
jgi:hypothetical protein